MISTSQVFNFSNQELVWLQTAFCLRRSQTKNNYQALKLISAFQGPFGITYWEQFPKCQKKKKTCSDIPCVPATDNLLLVESAVLTMRTIVVIAEFSEGHNEKKKNHEETNWLDWTDQTADFFPGILSYLTKKKTPKNQTMLRLQTFVLYFFTCLTLNLVTVISVVCLVASGIRSVPV